MSAKKKQWFGPTKSKVANSGAFGIYTWQGWLSTLIFIGLLVADIVLLYHVFILSAVVAVALIISFFVFAAKHGAKFTNYNIR